MHRPLKIRTDDSQSRVRELGSIGIYYSCEKFLNFLHRTKISAILAYFFPNLVAMATPLAPWKF